VDFVLGLPSPLDAIARVNPNLVWQKCVGLFSFIFGFCTHIRIPSSLGFGRLRNHQECEQQHAAEGKRHAGCIETSTKHPSVRLGHRDLLRLKVFFSNLGISGGMFRGQAGYCPGYFLSNSICVMLGQIEVKA
jgi:hypothetical protein